MRLKNGRQSPECGIGFGKLEGLDGASGDLGLEGRAIGASESKDRWLAKNERSNVQSRPCPYSQLIRIWQCAKVAHLRTRKGQPLPLISTDNPDKTLGDRA